MTDSRSLFQPSALEDKMHHFILKRTVFSVQILVVLSLNPIILKGAERIKACCVIEQIEEKEIGAKLLSFSHEICNEHQYFVVAKLCGNKIRNGKFSTTVPRFSFFFFSCHNIFTQFI